MHFGEKKKKKKTNKQTNKPFLYNQKLLYIYIYITYLEFLKIISIKLDFYWFNILMNFLKVRENMHNPPNLF